MTAGPVSARPPSTDVPRYYAWLSRFQDAMRWIGHDTGQRTLTVHRRLRSASGEVSGDVLHAHLLAGLGATATHPVGVDATGDGPLVLDAGCGLGGTAFFLHAHLGGRAIGLTLSPEQAARATAEAARRGVDAACRFAVRDYDGPLDDLLPAGADVIVAIESLAHAPDPAATIGRLAARLRPQGRLVVVDDMPADGVADNDTDLAGFRRGWHAPHVASTGAVDAALAQAGLTVVLDADLTASVPRRAAISLALRLLATRAVAPMATRTPARVLHEAILGGLHLERLYARGLVRYRLVIARRPGNR